MRLKVCFLFLVLFFALLITQPGTSSISSYTYVSSADTFNSWNVTSSTGGNANYSYSSNNSLWGNGSIDLQGTERISLNLTALTMDYSLTNNSLFRFAWNFPVKQSDYIGFILYTPINSYYIVSYFGPTVFANGTTQAIYEFTNEQTNTWYQHTVNLTSLFLQTYGSLPQKIVSVDLVNAHFNSTGLALSTQVSYFDNFMLYSGTTNLPTPNQPQNLTLQKTGNNIDLRWQKPVTNQIKVTHYTIYRSESPSTNFKLIGSTTSLNYTDANILLQNKTFYYVVRSYTIFGESIDSNMISTSTTTSTSTSTPTTSSDSSNQSIQYQKQIIIPLQNPTMPILALVGSAGIAGGGLYAILYTRKKRGQRSVMQIEKVKSDGNPWYIVILGPILGLLLLIRYVVPISNFNQLELLEHPIRRKIVESLQEFEFDHLNSLKTKVNCRISSLLWHLDILENQGIVQKQNFSQYTIVYLADKKPTLEEIEVYIGLKSEKATRIISLVINKHVTNVNDLAKSLQLKPSVIKAYLLKFVEMGAFKLDEKTNKITINTSWIVTVKKICLRRERELFLV